MCSCEEPLGATHTHNILESWEGESRWIGIMMSQYLIVRSGECSDSRHLPAVSRRNLSMYKLVFEVLSCHLIDISVSENRSRMS